VTAPLPSGVDASELDARLRAWEAAANLGGTRKSLFCDGERMGTSSALPWADEVKALAADANRRFLWADNWFTGAAYHEMEAEIVTWVAGLLHGDPGVTGLVTSGGSESNALGLLAARAAAGRRGSVVFPRHSHYSFPKACDLFGFEPIVVDPIPGTWGTVDPAAIERAIRHDTVAIALTAGTMPYGGIDPIEEVGRIAERRGIHLHVDACCGGFVLPFLERSGYDPSIPAWDLRVRGVRSISADLHKHGMAPSGSLLLLRDQELLAGLRSLCPPQGTLSGTRSAAPVAASWVTMRALGIDGYTATSVTSMRLRDGFLAAVESFPQLEVVPGSRINVFAFHAPGLDLFPVWEEMRRRGWMMIHKAEPPPVTLPVWTLPQNEGMAGTFREDLAASLEHARPVGAAVGDAAGVYGGLG
jgi:glutamate/tyrosine decarboxylase-like PLP-dependent enzyme